MNSTIGCPGTDCRCPTDHRRPRRSITASNAGPRSFITPTTSGTDRQQLDREPHPPDCHGPEKLAICRQPARRQTGGRHHEADPVSQAQRPRFLPLSEGRPVSPADAAQQPDRRTAANDAGHHRLLGRLRMMPLPVNWLLYCPLSFQGETIFAVYRSTLLVSPARGLLRCCRSGGWRGLLPPCRRRRLHRRWIRNLRNSIRWATGRRNLGGFRGSAALRRSRSR